MRIVFVSAASRHADLAPLPPPLEDDARQTKQLKKEAVARNGSWDGQTHVDKTGETYSIDFDRLHQTRLCQQKVYCQRCTYNLQCGERGA